MSCCKGLTGIESNLSGRHSYSVYSIPRCSASRIRHRGCGNPVVKVSDNGRHVMSSSPEPLKTRRLTDAILPIADESLVCLHGKTSTTSDVSEAVTVATYPCFYQSNNQEALSQSRPFQHKATNIFDVGWRNAPEETGDRQWEKSLDTRHRRLDDRYRVFTVARRLHGGGLFARRPVRYKILTPAHGEGVLCGAGTPELERQ
ncbi:hypothetical protein TNCV_1227871 [Trichonephila clavipes]|nr:hypothetical protein TNCV_1227871 [Trichonephila clavipes]